MLFRRRTDELGATSVEFALILPVLIGIVGIILMTGFYAIYAGLIQNAAREGVRLASVRNGVLLSSGYPSNDEVKAKVEDSLPGWLGDPEVVIDPTSAREGDRVTVTVSMSELPVLSVFDGFLSVLGIDGVASVSRSASERKQ